MKIVITSKGALIRNLATALINGAITLTLLLIAPLGLAAVVTNTVLITLSTFFIASLGDRVVQWLLSPEKIRGQIIDGPNADKSTTSLLPKSSQRLPQGQDGDRRNS